MSADELFTEIENVNHELRRLEGTNETSRMLELLALNSTLKDSLIHALRRVDMSQPIEGPVQPILGEAA